MLAPAWGRRLIPNQQHGDIALDEIPGLSMALACPGEQIDLTVTMLDGTAVSFTAVIPEITSALCLNLKALGWSDRLAAKDAVDIWRLLRAHTTSGFRSPSSGGTPASRAPPRPSSVRASLDRQVVASARRQQIAPNRPRSEP